MCVYNFFFFLQTHDDVFLTNWFGPCSRRRLQARASESYLYHARPSIIHIVYTGTSFISYELIPCYLFTIFFSVHRNLRTFVHFFIALPLFILFFFFFVTLRRPPGLTASRIQYIIRISVSSITQIYIPVRRPFFYIPLTYRLFL